MVLYVSCDADDAGKLIGRARLADDVEEVRRTSARLDRGLEILKSWALSVGGSVVEAGGDECSLEVPADHIGELPAVREQYADAVKCTLSVGVGVKLAESAKALYAAKLRGKDQIVFYSPECDELIKDAAKDGQTEAQKMREEYLDKAQPAMNPGPNAGFAGVSEPAMPSREQPVATQGDHEEGQVALDALGLDEGSQPSPEMTHASKDYEKQLHDEAWKGEEEDMKGTVDRRGRIDQVKQQVAQALQALKVKAPVLEQVRQVDPDAYKATMALVQSVIALAREASDTPDKVAKNDESIGQSLGKAEGVKDRVRQYTKQIQQVLSPDLLKPEYRGGAHCLAGHCYVAAEALYHLLGGKEAGWTPVHVQHEGGPHWFLRHASGRIADPTAAQFKTPVPYERGRGGGFLTYPVPSDRAREVMERMLTEQSLKPEDVAGIAGEKQLAKMAILDIPRGRKMKPWEGYDERTSYKHVLSPHQRAAGYSLHVVRAPMTPVTRNPNAHMAHLLHRGRAVGNVGFVHDPDSRTIHVKYALIDEAHRGKGLGVPMYEAAYAHARHALGATHVVGEEHSTAAKRVHESLSRKHGMFYEPHGDTGEGDDQEEPFDGRFQGYHYAIKSEDQDDSLSKNVKAKKSKGLVPPPAAEREELVHYSVKPGLKTIGVNHMGTGAKGAEYKQGIPEVARAYYYRAGSEPEPLVTQGAKARYTAHLDPQKHRLYDVGADPEGLRGPARERFLAGEGLETPEDTFLDAVRGRGYYGYHNSASAMPHVVALFHAHPVSKGEDLGKAEVKNKSIQAPKPTSQMELPSMPPADPLTTHPDPRGLVVYRVQGPEGEGPYNGVGPRSGIKSSAIRHFQVSPEQTGTAGQSQHGLMQPAAPWPNGERPWTPVVNGTLHTVQPTPRSDFEPHEWDDLPEEHAHQLYFGFESPEHARAWFGTPQLDEMRALGFELRPVRAQRVWRSKSGRQVVFLPHEDAGLGKAGDAWDAEKRELRDPHELDKATPRMPPQPVGAAIAQAPTGAAGSAAAVNKIKVQHSDGTTGTKQVEAGVIRSMDPSEHGTSSRSPNSK